ncbi:MAG: TonB-dependent receptor [Cytophagaceae bacterium]
MIKIKSLLALLIFFISTAALAQETYTIKGTLKDSLSGDAMAYASVLIKENGKGTAADENGNFSLSMPAGIYTIEISYLGYKTISRKINLKNDITLDLPMSMEEPEVQEVEIKDKKISVNVEDTKMSANEIDIKIIKKLPALFGEVDVIKNMQMMPGIQVAGEGNTGLYVRGGSPDQNLVLLDDAPVYNASHILGVFSIFNSDALKSAEIYKGGIPAQYGGRLSALVDIRTRDGNPQKFKMSGGIGLISSRLMIEGPIKKDKCSFMLSGRRTYGDLFLKLSNNPNIKKDRLYFYDFNLKLNYKFNDKNKLYLSGYHGRDIFDFVGLFGLNWGNTTASLRFNHLYNEKLVSNSVLAFSSFDYTSSFDLGIQQFKFGTGVIEKSFRHDFTWVPNKKNEVTFGTTITHRSYNPGKFEPGSDTSLFKEVVIDKYHSIDEAFYISNKQKFSNRVTIDYGLRYSLFTNIGKGVLYKYNGDLLASNITDTVQYNSFKSIKTYGGFEPRVSGRYMLTDETSIKASYNRTIQYIQLLSNSTSPIPSSIWVPSTPYIQPQKADQVATGYFRNFLNNTFEASVEGYYKWMHNAVDFKDNANLLLNPHIETELRRGKSWSYGLEFFVRKNKGKTTGWISYTWSKTQRKIPGVNEGHTYFASYDRRNNFNFVISHDFNERWNIAGNWIYGSGRPFTLPAARYSFDYLTASYYTQRNGYRMPAYHRMDISVNLNSKKVEGRRWESSWNFSVYNLYGRRNPYTIYTRDKKDHPGEKEVVMVYLFRWLPSVTYNFNF